MQYCDANITTKEQNHCNKNPLDKSVLGHFVQLNISRSVYEALAALIDESPYAAVLFFYCAMRCSRYNTITLDLPKVRSQLGCQERKLLYALHTLEKYNFILRTGKRGDHTYQINASLVWKNTREQRSIGIYKKTVFADPVIIPGSDTPVDEQNFDYFTQISATNLMISILSELAVKSPCGLKIAILMSMYSNEMNELEIKRADIAQAVNASERSVSTALALLSRYNIIESERHNKTVIYYLNTAFSFKNRARNIDNFKDVGALQKLRRDFDDGIDEIVKAREAEKEATTAPAASIKNISEVQSFTSSELKLPNVVRLTFENKEQLCGYGGKA